MAQSTKYHTITPTEARQMSRFMATNGRRPIRTASVMHKPRAPPLIVNDLDEHFGTLSASRPESRCQQDHRTQTLPRNLKTASHATTAGLAPRLRLPVTPNGNRSASSCSNYTSYRHSLNYGPNIYGTPRSLYIPSTADGFRPNPPPRTSARGSPVDLDSLSYKSSMDAAESAYGPDRFHAMSVDLGVFPHRQRNFIDTSHCNPLTQPYCDFQDHQSGQFSDNSYASAKSHISESGKLTKTPNKLNALSASTTKVFHNQLSSLKKFFRQMPIKRSLNNVNQMNENRQNSGNPSSFSHISQQSNLGAQNDFFISTRLSKQQFINGTGAVDLNQSQSPPVCPPPPSELKSMSYMENIAYSNYDEFTRARNQQASNMLTKNSYDQPNSLNSQNVSPTNTDISNNNSSIEAWQLASLPVAYERSLATVFEERQNSMTSNLVKISDLNKLDKPPNCQSAEDNPYMITPPATFSDSNRFFSEKKDSSDSSPPTQASSDSTTSTQSLSSVATSDSLLEYHRKNATAFRFSFGQPEPTQNDNSASIRSSALPPKIPATCEPPRANSNGSIASGNSTNGLTNGKYEAVNNRNANANRNDKADLTSIGDASSICGLGNLSALVDNDGDTTIISETSTIRDDHPGHMSCITKYNELERQVDSLKKKLTDSQLKQWSCDYRIEELKSTINRLEKENSQLKAVLLKINRADL